MKVASLQFNPICENTYVVWDDTNECIVVDAGKVVMDGPKAQVLAALSGARPVPQQPGQGGAPAPTNVHRHPSTQPADSKAAV